MITRYKPKKAERSEKKDKDDRKHRKNKEKEKIVKYEYDGAYDPIKPVVKKSSKRCGECSGCLRSENCGKCDACRYKYIYNFFKVIMSMTLNELLLLVNFLLNEK